ncbi:MAG: TlpA disulfide reductase family protein [Desulfobacca sp.]|nr:TlpA disulfide reductase family protein [Desulfobacca sp.]
MPKKIVFALLVALVSLYGLAIPGAMAEVKVGDTLGNLQFSKPLTPEDQKYLGLAQDATFTLKEVNAPYVLLEAFGTNCSHCLAQAPKMNNLYNLMAQNPKLAGKVKFIAVGGGDNQFGVTMWRKQLKIPFPVLPDQDTSLTKKLNIPGTPTSMLLDKSGKVLWVHIGAFDSAETALSEINSAIK